jgi:hypothetical protein
LSVWDFIIQPGSDHIPVRGTCTVPVQTCEHDTRYYLAHFGARPVNVFFWCQFWFQFWSQIWCLPACRKPTCIHIEPAGKIKNYNIRKLLTCRIPVLPPRLVLPRLLKFRIYCPFANKWRVVLGDPLLMLSKLWKREVSQSGFLDVSR